MNRASTIKKIIEIYREQGLEMLTKRSLKKIAYTFFETNSAFWLERDLSVPLSQVSSRIPVDIDLTSNEETISWIRINGEPWMNNELEIKTGIEENHYFPSIKYEGKIIGYAKVGFGKVYIHDFRKMTNFPNKVAFIYDTYILPEYRGMNLAPLFVNKIMQFLKDEGNEKLRCHIPAWNTASFRAYSKVGFKKKRFIRFFRILCFKFATGDPVNL